MKRGMVVHSVERSLAKGTGPAHCCNQPGSFISDHTPWQDENVILGTFHQAVANTLLGIGPHRPNIKYFTDASATVASNLLPGVTFTAG